MGVATAIVAGAVIAAGATAYAANKSSSAQKSANAQNAQNMADTNALNYRMFQEGRGSEGSALLPLYARDANGQLVEPQMFQDALDVYDATGALSPAQRRAQFQAIIDQTKPAQVSAVNTVNGIYDGSLTQEELDAQTGVAGARLDMARARKNAGLESIQQTLNEIRAINSRKGFSGDSSGTRALAFNARRQVNTDSATDLGAANLANETDIRGVKMGAVQRKVANLTLPYTMARQGIDLSNAADNATLDQQNKRMSLLNTFRLGQGQFQYQNMPTVQPVAGAGQIAGQAVGSLAGSLGNVAANQYIAQQLRTPVTSAPTTNPGLTTDQYMQNQKMYSEAGLSYP